MVAAGMGLALVGSPSTALAADKLATGGKFKVVLKEKDKKFYLQPSATVKLTSGQQVKFEYVASFGDAKEPAFKLIEAKAGTGTDAFETAIQGSPSPAFTTKPTKILVVHAEKPKGEPIVVEQPGS